ncbi:helix-turn-helix transcriptional regulator [Ornithinicoccus halotolerans]|uniref:helix-turn-helix transcriptional regulator n=1 Tax=Ornithinicoccus halotolerans TaxID=1748220 RepID=UPI001295A36B|nr:helix-turn-helix transcriptional regulator [Ornithinicoccus halotolerans]
MPPVQELYGMAYEDFLSRLYMAMIRLGTPTTAALVEEGYDAEDVEQAGQELAARGLVESSAPGRWSVQPPEIALGRLADVLEHRAHSSRNSAAELGALWRQARRAGPQDTPAGMEMISGRAEVVHGLRSVEGLARSELLVMLDGSPASREWLASERPDRLDGSGPALRCVLEGALMREPDVIARLRACPSSVQRVRVTTGLMCSLLISDGTVSVLDLTRHDEGGQGSFVARRSAPVSALTAAFEYAYTFATPVVPGTDDAEELAGRDRRVLELLAAGASDQVIARHTAISVRTVERRVRTLMDRLGATTRFQAGVQAARRGWL